MPDYQQGKIYKIKGGDECYIGSTTYTESHRYSAHKSNYKYTCRYSTTVSILFEKYGVENCSIEIIELFPCNNKKTLLEREAYWIENTVCVNKLRPIISDEQREAERFIQNKEYRELHRNELNERSLQYRKDNVDSIEQKQSEKMECECGKMVRRDYLKKHKKTQKHKKICGSVPQNAI